MAHPTLQLALDKAVQHIDRLKGTDNTAALEAELKKLSKKELIAKVLELSGASAKPIKVVDLAYAILEDPDCAWLTWDTIALLIQTHVPGTNTSVQSLQWYGTKGPEKGKNVVPRKPAKAIAALLVSEL